LSSFFIYYQFYTKLIYPGFIILESFKIADGVYKRQQVDAAVKLKNEITPYLINILEKVLADPYKSAHNSSISLSGLSGIETHKSKVL
jgi:hypothetical protein